jgi:stage III sporulation protein SpoIIIAA
MSRKLADDFKMRTNVVVVDTFKSIAGHELKANHIGRARRMAGIDYRPLFGLTMMVHFIISFLFARGK